MSVFTKGRKLGEKSVPFLASVFGYNSDQSSINQVDSYNNAGDLEDLFNTPSTSHHIRISIPDQIKKLTALHLEIKFVSNAAEPENKMKIALATEQYDFADPTYTDVEKDRQTAILKGPWDFELGETINLDLDILPLIGSSINYQDHKYFFISLFFTTAPSAWQKFEKFWVRAAGDLPNQFL